MRWPVAPGIYAGRQAASLGGDGDFAILLILPEARRHDCQLAGRLPRGDHPVPRRPVARPPGDARPPRRDDRGGHRRPDHARHGRRELLARATPRSARSSRRPSTTSPAGSRCSPAWPSTRRRWPAGSPPTRRGSGVDGLMVLPAMVYKSDPRETIAHFRAVARATDLPIMVYNNPVSYGVDITPAMFAELADEPTLVAIKESSENVRRITDLRNALRRPLRPVLRGRRPGPGELACSARSAGSRAWSTPSRRENRLLWDLADRRPVGRGPRGLPLVHAAAPPRHPPQARPVHQARRAECGLGTETVRAPRLPIEGARARGDPRRSSARRSPPGPTGVATA